MVMASIIGLMVGVMKDIGKMENNMVKENIFYLMGSPRLEYGKMGKEFDG